VTGTSDEQPEQAGRRQMAIQVADEILTIVLTDPVIVEAGKEALRAVNARAAEGAEGEGASATSTVIRGDNPFAVGLAAVWLELRKTLTTLADPLAQTRSVKLAVRLPSAFDPAEPGERSEPGEAGEAGEASQADEAGS
jgi:hypothetical protein